MANHFHLVMETPNANQVAGMKWFLGTYTLRFNRRPLSAPFNDEIQMTNAKRKPKSECKKGRCCDNGQIR